MSNKFTADFETTTDLNECRVWAYALMEIGNTSNFIYGNSIEDFIKWCSNKKKNYTLYFHNLKFDGEFIFNYLLENGFTCIKSKKERQNKKTLPKKRVFFLLIRIIYNNRTIIGRYFP